MSEHWCSLWPNCSFLCSWKVQFLKAAQVSLSLWSLVFWTSSPKTSLVVQSVRRLHAMQETWILSLNQEDPLETEMAISSSFLAWEIPRTEARLQYMGTIGHDLVTKPPSPPQVSLSVRSLPFEHAHLNSCPKSHAHLHIRSCLPRWVPAVLPSQSLPFVCVRSFLPQTIKFRVFVLYICGLGSSSEPVPKWDCRHVEYFNPLCKI